MEPCAGLWPRYNSIPFTLSMVIPKALYNRSLKTETIRLNTEKQGGENVKIRIKEREILESKLVTFQEKCPEEAGQGNRGSVS